MLYADLMLIEVLQTVCEIHCINFQVTCTGNLFLLCSHIYSVGVAILYM